MIARLHNNQLKKGLNMATLSEDMKTFIENNLAWIATISKDGELDLGPKM